MNWGRGGLGLEYLFSVLEVLDLNFNIVKCENKENISYYFSCWVEGW